MSGQWVDLKKAEKFPAVINAKDAQGRRLYVKPGALRKVVEAAYANGESWVRRAPGT